MNLDGLCRSLESLTVTAGKDKLGCPERLDVVFRPGQISALLGPTGSGKSRFLSDIESLACGDTPTGRSILLNRRQPDAGERFALQGRLVAQLTQNMNFVLDMRAEDFILAHAESREVPEPGAAAQKVLEAANRLAGEPFSPEKQLTQLSGGQSRALMIADTALLSSSPVILIDEIENAGVDKGNALDLLIKSDKIIVIATHDPVLALSAHRRIVFGNGAVNAVVERTTAETRLLEELVNMERKLSVARDFLRLGNPLPPDLNGLPTGSR
jgi:ABC-type lipoprotein export system ATPase subunit